MKSTVNKNTVLLTGGSGMVGRNILSHPASLEWNILSPSSKELNLTDYKVTLNYIKKTNMLKCLRLYEFNIILFKLVFYLD